MIAGVKAMRYDGDHVQSSSASDRMADGVLKIDEVLERMNRETSKELNQELSGLETSITLVNTALIRMDLEIRSAIKQHYIDGVPVKKLTQEDGQRYHYRTAAALLHEGIKAFANFLMHSEEIKRRADAMNTIDENSEGWYD